MQSPNVILYEYDQMLLGKAKNFKISFQGSPNSEQNKRELQIVWRYAFEKLLGWTPAQAIELVNNELVVSLMLDITLNKAGIRFNPKKDFDFRAVLQYVYPERVKYSIEQDAISEFESNFEKSKMQEYEKTYEKQLDSCIELLKLGVECSLENDMVCISAGDDIGIVSFPQDELLDDDVNTLKLTTAPLFDFGAAYWSSGKIDERIRSNTFGDVEKRIFKNMKNRCDLEAALKSDGYRRCIETYPRISQLKKQNLIDAISRRNKTLLIEKDFEREL